jgi:hypothetical protein
MTTGSASAGERDDDPLSTARSFLKADQIPPAGVGAYGVVSLQSKATEETNARLIRICKAYVAHFPLRSSLPSSVALGDQMVTVWPVTDPTHAALKRDDCRFAVDNYDLYAGQAAISDARRQRGKVDGEGPFLIGWSPSDSRGRPDRLVLVVDLSEANSQASIDHAFRFWKQKVVDDPAMWRQGFSMERLRLSLRDFIDKYGVDLVNAVKLSRGASAPP